MTNADAFRRILITGASGQLGIALVRRLAAPGRTLVLCGRNEERLRLVAQEGRRAGAEVSVETFDLEDVAGAREAVLAADTVAPVDLAVLAAGLGDTRGPGATIEDAAQVQRVLTVNFVATASLCALLAERMTARQAGTIVVIGSAAGFHALPAAPAYSSSKAGLARFTHALRIAAAPHGVGITLAMPGFIDGDDARAQGRARPLALAPDRAAHLIVEAALQGRPEIVTPRTFAALRYLDRILPRLLRDWLLSRLAP